MAFAAIIPLIMSAISAAAQSGSNAGQPLMGGMSVGSSNRSLQYPSRSLLGQNRVSTANAGLSQRLTGNIIPSEQYNEPQYGSSNPYMRSIDAFLMRPRNTSQQAQPAQTGGGGGK